MPPTAADGGTTRPTAASITGSNTSAAVRIVGVGGGNGRPASAATIVFTSFSTVVTLAFVAPADFDAAIVDARDVRSSSATLIFGSMVGGMSATTDGCDRALLRPVASRLTSLATVWSVTSGTVPVVDEEQPASANAPARAMMGSFIVLIPLHALLHHVRCSGGVVRRHGLPVAAAERAVLSGRWRRHIPEARRVGGAGGEAQG